MPLDRVFNKFGLRGMNKIINKILLMESTSENHYKIRNTEKAYFISKMAMLCLEIGQTIC
jgi:hypothetical protein